MLLICPWPTQRRLMAKRSAPGSTPAWEMVGAMLGLNKAADAKAYSSVKYTSIRGFHATLGAEGSSTRRAASS